ncbi:MAG TPA: hypothetical protein VNU26_03730 [Mycobacteriales bacterium]|nr:hypothetical protein [Mycobacteriales bacterium]
MTTAPAPTDVGELDRSHDWRLRQLTQRVAALRTKRLGGTPDRWLLVVGSVLMPLGAVLVLLGWAGASRTPLVFEQIPYLISGGLLGLGFVLAGGFVYFSYWLTLLVREQRQARDDLQTSLRRVEELLAASTAAAAPAVVPVPVQGGPPAVPARRLVATATGSMMHRPECAAVAGRENLREVTPETAGLTPCRICEPLLDD